MRNLFCRCFLLLLLIFIACDAFAASADTLAACRQLYDQLLLKGADRRFPTEFSNFQTTLASAEALVAANSDKAVEVMEFAMVKGRIIERKLLEPVVEEPPAVNISEMEIEPEQSEEEPDVAFEPPPQTVSPGADALIGGEQAYIVKKGDTIKLVGAKLGIARHILIKDNGLNPKNPIIHAGDKLIYNNMRIVPKKMKDGLIVNIPDRTLYFFKKGALSMTAPITVGISKTGDPKVVDPKKQVMWRTPTGRFSIIAKSKDPIWTVPPSIQEEMREQGKEVLTKVLPGKKNPLGRYALKTSIGGVMLHSTNMPTSIYGFNSHGCIRVYPDHMETLFKDVKVKTKGEIIYMPIKVAVTVDGRVFLEVHRDVYEKTKDIRKEVQRLAGQYKVTDKIDWQKVVRLIKEKNGRAEEVTLDNANLVKAPFPL